MQSRIAAIIALSLITGVAAADVRVEYSSVNKSIRIDDEQRAGDLHSVNGSIDVGDFAVVGEVDSVNGGIRLAEGVTARSVESVNGTVRLGRNVTIEGNVETVNGGLDAEPGVRIGGEVSTVNGHLDLDTVIVESDVVTYNGGISLRGGTVVSGDIRVKKSRSEGWSLFRKKPKPVRVEIGRDAVVQGDLYFERPVRLSVEDGAQIGQVHGENVEYRERK